MHSDLMTLNLRRLDKLLKCHKKHLTLNVFWTLQLPVDDEFKIGDSRREVKIVWIHSHLIQKRAWSWDIPTAFRTKDVILKISGKHKIMSTFFLFFRFRALLGWTVNKVELSFTPHPPSLCKMFNSCCSFEELSRKAFTKSKFGCEQLKYFWFPKATLQLNF